LRVDRWAPRRGGKEKTPLFPLSHLGEIRKERKKKGGKKEKEKAFLSPFFLFPRQENREGEGKKKDPPLLLTLRGR